MSSFVLVQDELIPISEISSLDGEGTYVFGAITLIIGGEALLSDDMRDDINWLWPYLVETIEKCRTGEPAQCYFPSCPLVFSAALVGQEFIQLSVSGRGVDRSLLVDSSIALREIGSHALAFFAHYHRLFPNQSAVDLDVLTVAESWL